MTFRLGCVRLRLHPLLPLLWVIAFIGGAGRFLSALAALLLHESGHWMAARLCGVPITEVEITPLGGVMTVQNQEAISRRRQFLLALAGPVFSAAGCAAAPALFSAGVVSFANACAFAKANLFLLLFNLLPVLPLDGGQMLRAVLSRFFPAAAMTRMLNGAAAAIGLLLCAVSLYFSFRGMLILSPAFCGLYLICAAAADGQRCTARYVTALIARRQRLENHSLLPIEAVATGADMPAGALLRRLTPGKYHVILVLAPDGMTSRGLIEEKDFCEAVLTRPDLALGQIAAEKKSLLS